MVSAYITSELDFVEYELKEIESKWLFIKPKYLILLASFARLLLSGEDR